MNRIERKLLVRTLLLGLLVTGTVVAMDVAGWLRPLERWFWDHRARWCQWFTPPPPDRIVHVMIDDEALQSVGAWPWPRSVLARVLDELSLAGAKVVAMDIFFPEPHPPGDSVDHDAALAASIGRSGRVLLPNSVEFLTNAPPDPLMTAAEEEFERDPELTPADLRQRLIERGLPAERVGRELPRLTVQPRSRGMQRRIARELQATTRPEEIRPRVIPRGEGSGMTSDATYLFAPTLDRARAVRSLRRFGGTVPAGVPLLRADGERAVSISILTAEARASGFVDVLPGEDGAVRSLPLFINYRGMLWPTMALTLACLELGADPADCIVSGDAIVIRAPSGERRVPVRVARSREFGEVGTLFDIPWHGTDEWVQMYDRPGGASNQFLPIKALWTIGQLELDVRQNNQTVDQALLALARPYRVEEALTFLARPPEERSEADRSAAVAAVAAIAIDDPGAAESLKLLAEADPTTLTEEDQRYLSAAMALRRGVDANRALRGLIDSRRAQVASLVKGKVVIIGWSATGKLDFFPTSIHSGCPGSVIQGVVFSSIISGHVLRSHPQWVAAAITLGMGVVCTLAVARLTPWRAALTAGVVAGVYALVNGVVLYDWGNQVVGVAGPVVGAGATWTLLTLSKFINETRERSRITRRFRSYVDPALVDYVIEHPERMSLEGEAREVTVAFTDLAGFTPIAELLQERAVPILNQYMGQMVPIIRRHRGLVNKFLGDGIMFFYGAPREHPHKARAAVQTVLEMNAATRLLNDQLRAQGLPPIHMRAGIATGMVVVGDAGAIEGDQQASDYTVLGDRVNLAARLEAANKAFGTAVLIERLTCEQARDYFLIRPIGCVRVKGKEEGVDLYEPVCLLSDATDEQKAEAQAYERLVATYRAADFEACRATAAAIAERFGPRKVLELYTSLCDEFSDPARRAEFSGTVVLTEK